MTVVRTKVTVARTKLRIGIGTDVTVTRAEERVVRTEVTVSVRSELRIRVKVAVRSGSELT